ncbi:MAG: hypothetical protein V2I37_02665 [Marinilabiliaceae bacterium]|jgi:glycine cleavage system H lipoate-binding protein|nr:hypothetical protein [Marinilabiliaceae bacterium]
MKKLLFYLFTLCLVFLSNGIQAARPVKNAGTTDTLKVYVDPLQKDLMEKLSASYKSYSGIGSISLLEPAQISGSDDSYLLVKAEPALGFSGTGGWFITLGREILVPVINNKNPESLQILGKGIMRSDLKRMLESAPVQDASSLTGAEGNTKGIVFCRLSDIVSKESGELLPGIQPVPFDINKNGRIDGFENNCQTYSDIERSVWMGKYPRELFTEIRLISGSKPADRTTLDFVEWLVTGGQAYIAEAGLTNLILHERRTALNSISTAAVSDEAVSDTAVRAYSPFIWIISGLALLMLAAFASLFFSRVPVIEAQGPSGPGDLNMDMIRMPGGLMYDNAYTWAYLEKEASVKVGITDLLQHFTGKISKLKLRNEGEMVKKGDLLFTLVQDGKHLDIVSPVSGTISKMNTRLEGNGAILNKSPYDEGWIYELKPVSWVEEASVLKLGSQFRSVVENEIRRLKDFVERMQLGRSPGMMIPVMQEGGEIKDGFLEQMDPEFWEEFQNEFINRA